MLSPEGSGSLKKRKKNNKVKDEGFLASIELKRVLYFAVIPFTVFVAAVYIYVLTNDLYGGSPDVDKMVERQELSVKSPLPLSTEFNIRKHPITELLWSDENGFLEDIISSARPTLIKGSPTQTWPVASWDLAAMASAGLLLNSSRLQTASPVFVLGYERDKGGMLMDGVEDKSVSYVDVYLKDFLHTVFDPHTYLYWTGPCAVLETFQGEIVDKGSSPSSFGEWEFLKVVDSSVNITRSDGELWRPMLWLSHPGVVAQTHFDTQHNFFAQVMGRKKMLIFEQYSELYPYPNIHRRYRQSQIHLENATLANLSSTSDGRTMAERFPKSKKLDAVEVSLLPGDLLYIPPYWSHRVESETLSMSISVLSPSSTEVALAEAYWAQVPFGPFESGDSIFRSGAVKLFLYYIVGMAEVLADLSLPTFSSDLLHSRYLDLYPVHSLRKLKSESNFRCPSTNDEKLTSLMEEHAQKFHDAALEITGMVDRLIVHRSVKEMFYRDYAEQIVRWAVGPNHVPLFLKYCLGGD